MKIEIEPEIFNQLSKEEKLEYCTELLKKIKWEIDGNGVCCPSNLEYHHYNGIFKQKNNLNGILENFHRIKPEPEYAQFTYEDRSLFMGKEVKHKTNKINYVVVGCHDEQLFIGENWVCYNIAFKHYVFADGSPFGKKVV